jgi:hypothetical protein
MDDLGEDLQRLHETGAGPIEVLVPVGDIDTPLLYGL